MRRVAPTFAPCPCSNGLNPPRRLEMLEMGERRPVWIAVAATAAVLVPAGAVLAHSAAIRGSDGADVLAGTNGRDRIVAFAGNDRVDAKLGRDHVWAGEGSDTVNDGDGRDVVFGGSGSDSLYGGRGNDRIFARRGVDRVFGGSGNDDLWAMAREDVSQTLNEPADTLAGGPGHDRF